MPLAAGDILHVYVQSLRNPKHKYCVLACIEPQPLLLLINSELTDFKQAQPDLLAAQLAIDAASHPFLRYDSWLDCSEPHGYSSAGLTAEYGKDPKIVVGRISDAIRPKIIETVKRARTVSRRNVGWIVQALTAAPSQGDA